ncbi:hypothetical protein M9458_044087 [Cirrhinus mrigala]|uniref:TLDc domain-containing protein n=1 Tax=Cirrhinus mrigala TaxID=683832 RepID=A0ABD0NGD7_CIRMR
MYSAFGAPRTLTSKLTEEQRKQLRDLLGNLELTLLYKASVHGYQASAFHQQCDNQGPTLLVAYNRSGYIFGGYTSVDYAQSGQQIIDDQAFLFSVHDGGDPQCIKINSGCYARSDDAGGPNFGQQLYFCYNNHPIVLEKNQYNSSIPFNSYKLYGNDTWLIECEVYKVEQRSTLLDSQVSAEEKPWRNVQWKTSQRVHLIAMIRSHKPLIMSMSRVRILMIGPVGAGKSSFFNSINSIFMGHITSKAMSGSAGTSLTTQFRTYPVKSSRQGKLLPFVLCDTMGLEEQSGAGLNIEDISSILQGHVPDSYTFNPTVPFCRDEQNMSGPASLPEKIHCVVYVIDTTKISLISDNLEEKLTSIRRNVNSLGNGEGPSKHLCQFLHQVEGETWSHDHMVCSYRTQSDSRLGVPVSCVLPVKNYSQELELELNCDVLLLTALQQMLRFADDYLDDVDPRKIK